MRNLSVSDEERNEEFWWEARVQEWELVLDHFNDRFDDRFDALLGNGFDEEYTIWLCSIRKQILNNLHYSYGQSTQLSKKKHYEWEFS